MFLRRLVERYAEHPAMGMWDIWNEPESSVSFRKPDISTLLCYCDNCKREFVDWLRNRYGGIQSVNDVWGRCYSNWNEIELPREPHTFTDMVDWRLFACTSQCQGSSVENCRNQIP